MIKELSIQEHILSKDMWAGSKDPISQKIILLDPINKITETFAPAMLKCIDEVLINALDQYSRDRSVSVILVSFDGSFITVQNDGTGINIGTGPNYEPFLAFGRPFTGSNMDISNSEIGGTNGLGVKITNIMSLVFQIVTHSNGMSYSQTWTDHMQNVSEPVIKESQEAGTIVKFKLDTGLFKSEINENIILYRIQWLALYVRVMELDLSIYYNGKKIVPNLISETLLFEKRDFKIYVHFGHPNIQMAVVNGIIVHNGNFMTYILKQLRKKNPGTQISFLVFWKTKDTIHWDNQSKSRLDVSSDLLQEFTLSSEFLSRCYTPNKSKGSKLLLLAKDPINNKYRHAIKAGKESHKCTLLLVEGDSAMTQIKFGISVIPDASNYYGIFSLGGVIPNAYKWTKIKEGLDSRIIKEDKTISKNIVIQNLFTILGLRSGMKYKDTGSLNYGTVIACVDQDLDGTGNIFSLIISLFYNYFPELIQMGYLKRLNTPIIRVFSGKKLLYEFYTEEEFKSANIKGQYRIDYLKGLGSHSPQESRSIFQNLEKNLVTYTIDPECNTYVPIYLGLDADKRKIILSNRRQEPNVPLLNADFPISWHMRRETHLYQLDNIGRKLPGLYDGLNEVNRKIIAALSYDAYARNSEMKVAKMAAYIAERMAYHHGEMSLESALKKKMFTGIGGVQLCFFYKHGQFGSRARGGKDAAAARYIHARTNGTLLDIIFPNIDLPLLEFVYDENQKCEPRQFIPIVPMAVLGTMVIPAHGWKIAVYARNVFDTIEYVKKLIKNESTTELKLRYWTYWSQYEKPRYKGYIKNNISYGVFTKKIVKSKLCINITELPLFTWTDNYISDLKEEGSLKIVDRSGPEKIDIDIIVNKENMTDTEIIKTFKLSRPLTSELNMLEMDGRVRSFSNYRSIILVWFQERKKLYIRRHELLKIIYSAKCDLLSHTVQFIKDFPKIKDDLSEALTKYPKIDNGSIKSLDVSNIYGPKANHDYLLDLRARDLSNEGLIKWQKKLTESQIILNDHLKQIPEETQWLLELDRLKTELLKFDESLGIEK
jgi:DNA gyrase/topoisomerase IV subunit B